MLFCDLFFAHLSPSLIMANKTHSAPSGTKRSGAGSSSANLTYHEFINQSYEFPPKGFQVIDEELHFHGVNLMEVIETYKTPIRVTYMPVIGQKVQQARQYFAEAMRKVDYQGNYVYCYCTKSSHFKHIMSEVLKSGVQLETSSAFDHDCLQWLQGLRIQAVHRGHDARWLP